LVKGKWQVFDMNIDKEKIQELAARLLRSRMRILQEYGFFGLLLMHVKYAVDDSCSTAATDGERFYFNPDFVDKLSDWELDVVMLHEILHIVLKHIFRGADFEDKHRFNIACDIVINSNIMKEMNRTQSIVLRNFGELMHLAPNGKEGHLYTAEKVYTMLPKQKKEIDKSGRAGHFYDDHSKWGTLKDPDYIQDKWEQHIYSAAIAAEAFVKAQGTGLCSTELVERILQDLRKPQLDWRTILNNFVQEETTDYSWLPPDRRFDESSFFLPDFNDKEQFVRDILFMIDTSGSMSEEQVAVVFSEVKGSIDQFNGKLNGKLGFFSHEVVPPTDFDSVESLMMIKPKGGGGTNFECVFEYVNEHMKNSFPTCIIMLTDGHAIFPDENITSDIPVLWLLTNNHVHPPWGRIARIEI
jgi:predicted metal-dependent peptidase